MIAWRTFTASMSLVVYSSPTGGEVVVYQPSFDPDTFLKAVRLLFTREILNILAQYIKIPNLSPDFDPDWEKHGYMQKAAELFASYARGRDIKRIFVKVYKFKGRTPLIYIDIPAFGKSNGQTALLYGHLDKQPPMEGWSRGLGPFTPVRKGNRLYGRGAADDGYAMFAALAAIETLQAQGLSHPRCVILIEAREESGSDDLPFYVERLAKKIGTPGFVVCLDSGCGDYDNLWLTTSLRGVVMGNLKIGVLKEGVHSGDATGIVPSSVHILARLLIEIQDAKGHIQIPELHVSPPSHRIDQAEVVATVLEGSVYSKFPWLKGVKPLYGNPFDSIMARTWKPGLSVTGMEGIPLLKDAGNVRRPSLTARLSMRIPPGLDAEGAAADLKRWLETRYYNGAHLKFDIVGTSSGWDAPLLEPWLSNACAEAAGMFFPNGRCLAMGEGGTIPFMQMLSSKFPNAQFMVTGVLGPESNAHGPNEFLHVPTAERLTATVGFALHRFGSR